LDAQRRDGGSQTVVLGDQQREFDKPTVIEVMGSMFQVRSVTSLG
jgi:hypothetical protein